LARNIDSPDAQAAARNLAQAAGEGATRGIVGAIAQQDTAAVTRVIAQQLAPVISQSIGQQVRESISAAMTDENGQRLQRWFHGLLNEEVFPRVREVLRQSAADALLVATRPDVEPAVVQNSHNLSLGATVGSRDGLIQLGVLDKDGGFTPAARVMLWGVGGMMALIAVATVALLVVLIMIAMALRRRSFSLPATGTTLAAVESPA
jgi:hypothetical protein